MPDFFTSNIYINILIFIASFYLLIKGSDLFVDASVQIAKTLGVSPLIIGLTLVSIGTSLPELASSIYAASLDQPDFVVGNVVGSCTTNITAMLGVAIIIGKTLSFPAKLLNRDALLMVIVFAVTLIMTYFIGLTNSSGEKVYGIAPSCGILLLLGAVAYCYYLFRHPEEIKDEIIEDKKEEIQEDHTVSIFTSLMLLTIGFILIYLSSKGLVDTVSWGAIKLNISPMVISGTIVAFGTSVPELAVTIAAVLKGRSDLAIGNIIGSCIFNIFLIIGICALITPLTITTADGMMNLFFMMGSGLLLFTFMLTARKLVRIEGFILFLGYIGFLLYNIFICK